MSKYRPIIVKLMAGLVSRHKGTIELNFGNINPIVGASGIVSALMGAYLYLFPNARLLVLVPFGVLFPTTIKAKFFMIFWLIDFFTD